MFTPLRLLGFFALVATLSGLPTEAQAWWDSGWSYRKELTIDGGATGGVLPSDAGRVPVLIRLHDGDFKFTDAKDDGTDIRFIAPDDKTPLNYHIELYDPVLGQAMVWVDVPDIKAGTTSKFWMYYGNKDAASGSNSHAAYDADQVLIYHFTEKDAPPRDWTSYGNTALDGIKGDSGSLIGSGVAFDGSHALVLPATPSLGVAAGGPMSLSVWIKPAAAASQTLYARRDTAGALTIGLDRGIPYFSAGTLRGSSDTPLTPGQWHQIAFTADATLVLYVDGVAKSTVAGKLPALATGATVGGDAPPVAAPGAVTAGFVGGMDELEISKVARPSGYIRALYASQGPTPALVKYGQDETNSAGGSGYFVIILKSVTLDGWVIIGLLMVLAVASWFVMYDRVAYLNRVSSSNAAFLEAYRRAGRDLVRFEEMMLGSSDRKPTPAQFRKIERSPLFRLLQAGTEELRERFGREGSDELHGVALTDGAIESIRASIEGVLVVETQALSRLMVVLTIAISGGPFIGLLGTVVGVMITFAAIAASGDVNVNAIAPGIAAALVATCAGLFVAIPALFAYNYLLLRIKDEQSKMQVYVEQLIARLAELYHSTPHLHALAAE